MLTHLRPVKWMMLCLILFSLFLNFVFSSLPPATVLPSSVIACCLLLSLPVKMTPALPSCCPSYTHSYLFFFFFYSCFCALSIYCAACSRPCLTVCRTGCLCHLQQICCRLATSALLYQIQDAYLCLSGFPTSTHP